MKTILSLRSLIIFASCSSLVLHLSQGESDDCSVTYILGICRRASGKFLPRDHRPHLHDFIILSSNLSSIENDFSSLRNLKTLLIDSSDVTLAFQNNFLHSLVRLRELRITFSNLTGAVFHSLGVHENLRLLSLFGNNITDVKNGYFSNLSRLEFIDLSENQITQIDEGAFDQLPALIEVNLQRNKIGRNFDPSFLNLPPEFSFCASSPCDNCPRDVAERSKVNLGVDYLWRTFEVCGTACVIVRLTDNPVCEKIGEMPLDKEVGGSKVNVTKVGKCQFHLVGSCSTHEKRRLYLEGACGKQRTGSSFEPLNPSALVCPGAYSQEEFRTLPIVYFVVATIASAVLSFILVILLREKRRRSRILSSMLQAVLKISVNIIVRSPVDKQYEIFF